MAKGRPRAFDKDKVLDIALKLFWQYGYEGTSISQLAEGMGINIPSLYAAFGNKENLFVSAVQRYGEVHAGFYQEAFTKKTAKEVARTLLEGEIKLVTKPLYPNGCLMVQGALATSPLSQPIRDVMSQLRAGAEAEICCRFERAIEEGDLPQNTDPAALACYIMTINSGIAVQAAGGVSREQLVKVVEIVMRNWGSFDSSPLSL